MLPLHPGSDLADKSGGMEPKDALFKVAFDGDQEYEVRKRIRFRLDNLAVLLGSPVHLKHDETLLISITSTYLQSS